MANTRDDIDDGACEGGGGRQRVLHSPVASEEDEGVVFRLRPRVFWREPRANSVQGPEGVLAIRVSLHEETQLLLWQLCGKR